MDGVGIWIGNGVGNDTGLVLVVILIRVLVMVRVMVLLRARARVMVLSIACCSGVECQCRRPCARAQLERHGVRPAQARRYAAHRRCAYCADVLVVTVHSTVAAAIAIDEGACDVSVLPP